MTATLRRNACPTLAAPMPTGDGLLARLNPVSGGISPSALAALADAAAVHGNGLLEVTRRGSLQIRGLTTESAMRLADAVNSIGIGVRTGVPVETGPLAGLDPGEIVDPRPLAAEIRGRIEAAGLSARLAPKVSVVLDGGGKISMDEVLADVRLEAVRCGGTVLWQASVAGTAATARAVAMLGEDGAADLTLATLHAVAQRGRPTRVRDLAAPEMLALLREVMRAGDHALDSKGKVSVESHSIAKGPVAMVPLTDGRAALGIGLPFGQSSAESLAALARAAGRHGVDEFRLSPGRTLLALCPTTGIADQLRREAADLDFVTDRRDPRLSVVACAGAPACASGHIATKRIAAEIAASSSDLLDGSFVVHVSGCEKSCAQPPQADFTLLGAADGCHVLAGRQELLRVVGNQAAAAFRRAVETARQQKSESAGTVRIRQIVGSAAARKEF